MTQGATWALAGSLGHRLNRLQHDPSSRRSQGIVLQLLASKSPQVRGCRGKLLWSHSSMPSCVGLEQQRCTIRLEPANKGWPTAKDSPQVKQSLRPSQGWQQEKSYLY